MNARLVIAAGMAEDRGPDSLEAHLRKLLKDFGLFGYHPHTSNRSAPGWPDWVIVGNRIIYRELKTEHGSLSPAQREVGERITRAGGDWAVWRPRDLVSGRIARELADVASIQAAMF